MRSKVVARRIVETMTRQVGGHRILACQQLHALVHDAGGKVVDARIVVDHGLGRIEILMKQGLPRQTDGVAHIAGHMVEVVGHRFEAFIENHAHVFTLPVAARALCTQSL